MIALIVACFVIVVLTSIVTITAIQLTKESFVQNGEMVDRDGSTVRVANSDVGITTSGLLCPRGGVGSCSGNATTAVQTSEVRSFAALFDLPRFDSRTLATLREVSLQLADGSDVTLSISGAWKHPAGLSAILYTTSGNRIIIDGTTMTAFV